MKRVFYDGVGSCGYDSGSGYDGGCGYDSGSGYDQCLFFSKTLEYTRKLSKTLGKHSKTPENTKLFPYRLQPKIMIISVGVVALAWTFYVVKGKKLWFMEIV